MKYLVFMVGLLVGASVANAGIFKDLGPNAKTCLNWLNDLSRAQVEANPKKRLQLFSFAQPGVHEFSLTKVSTNSRGEFFAYSATGVSKVFSESEGVACKKVHGAPSVTKLSGDISSLVVEDSEHTSPALKELIKATHKRDACISFSNSDLVKNLKSQKEKALWGAIRDRLLIQSQLDGAIGGYRPGGGIGNPIGVAPITGGQFPAKSIKKGPAKSSGGR